MMTLTTICLCVFQPHNREWGVWCSFGFGQCRKWINPIWIKLSSAAAQHKLWYIWRCCVIMSNTVITNHLVQTSVRWSYFGNYFAVDLCVLCSQPGDEMTRCIFPFIRTDKMTKGLRKNTKVIASTRRQPAKNHSIHGTSSSIWNSVQ